MVHLCLSRTEVQQTDCQARALLETLAKMDSLQQNATIEDRYSPLMDILGAPDLSLALSLVELCSGPEQDGILDLLVLHLKHCGTHVGLLKALIEQEISTTGKMHAWFMEEIAYSL